MKPHTGKMMSRATIALLFLATAVTASPAPGRHKTTPGRLETSLAQHPQRRLPSSQYTRLAALRGGASSITVAASPSVKQAPQLKEAGPVVAVMAAHGLLLIGCGACGTGVVGTATGLTMVTCAGLTATGSYAAYMAGVHVALLVQLVSTGAFAVQATRATLTPPVWSIMSTSSIAAFAGTSKQSKQKAINIII